jgi:hypothetical protein
MNFYDTKFVAQIKDSPYLIKFNWQRIPSDEFSGHQNIISFAYVNPDPDLQNVSMYASKNILEEDIMYASMNGLDTKLVEIKSVHILYDIN